MNKENGGCTEEAKTYPTFEGKWTHCQAELRSNPSNSPHIVEQKPL